MFPNPSRIFLIYEIPSSGIFMVRETGHLFQTIEDRLGPPPGMRYLKKNVPGRNIILTEPETGWVLPAYCDHYVFIMYGRRAGTMQRESNVEEKLAFTHRLLKNGDEVSREQYSKLLNYGISHIYLDRRRSQAEVVEKFSSQPRLFHKIFESPVDVIIEVIHGPAGEHTKGGPVK